ncbi:MAG: M3 family oligoendopeptidase [Spirochaetia bacterium]|jgi:oligoendopeptidase F
MSGAREESFSTGAQDVRWNLDDLYPAPAFQRIDAEMAGLEPEVDSFAARFRGRIGSLGAQEMSELLRGYEALSERMGRAGSYAQLSWATQSDDPARGALLQKQMEVESRLSQRLVFIDIEWANAPEDSAGRVLDDPLLARWRHWLILSRRYRPHLLSEPEEKILREKSVTGRQAWSRFFDETHSAALYDWEGSRVPQQMLLTQLYSADRGARQKAAASLTRGLREIQRPTTFVANTILADFLSENRLRRYPTWISSRNMDNQVDDATVEALVQAVCSRYDLVARYYRLKKKLLGLTELFDYDRYAPLAGEERRYSWEEAREIVLRAYGKFDPEMARIASLFFEKGWIDAAVHPGKRGGAFCASTVPSLHPYVMLNYQGRSEDVLTLAHELGHGVHQYVSRPRGILSWSTPLTTAETASIFGETLVFHDLLAREKDPRAVLSMLVRRIESSFATVFRQVAMNRFEDAIHRSRADRELTPEELCTTWLSTQRAMFGDSLTMTDDYGIWWSYIPHFIHTPGYVYAYAFGDLLVRALYARYREESRGFSALYLEMLSAGGSDWPHALVKPLGVDLGASDFWLKGLDLLAEMVSQAEDLASRKA